MRVAIRSAAVVAAVLLVFGHAVSAQAQVLGTYRWALLPYCNVLTLLVEQKGAGYQLSGTDDQCGAPVAAAASGTAHINPNGTASIALNVVRSDGISIPTAATISIVTLSGTWSDEYGNSGAFNFNPAGAAGSPRRVTMRGSYGIIFNAAAVGQDDTSSFSFTLPLPAAPLVPAANIIASGGPPTANCPGTFDAPLAAPGHLCIYERIRGNSGLFTVINSQAVPANADRTGGTVFLRSAAIGQAFALGKWAVTLP